MRVLLVAAMEQGRGIGLKGRLPWPPLPRDHAHVHALLRGRPALMGHHSFDTPDRIASAAGNVVLSSRKNLLLPEGFRQATSLPGGLALAGPATEVVVLGGGQVFEQALPLATEIYLTLVHGSFQADAFFPVFESDFFLAERQDFPADADHPVPYSFLHYIRKKT